MINSRKIEDLTPNAQKKYREFLDACEKAGLKILVISTPETHLIKLLSMHKVEQNLEES